MRLSRAPGGLELPHRPLLPPRMSSMSLLTDYHCSSHEFIKL
jgi:hypothetical protein